MKTFSNDHEFRKMKGLCKRYRNEEDPIEKNRIEKELTELIRKDPSMQKKQPEGDDQTSKDDSLVLMDGKKFEADPSDKEKLKKEGEEFLKSWNTQIANEQWKTGFAATVANMMLVSDGFASNPTGLIYMNRILQRTNAKEYGFPVREIPKQLSTTSWNVFRQMKKDPYKEFTLEVYDGSMSEEEKDDMKADYANWG